MIRVEKGPISSGNSYGFVNSGDFGVAVMLKSEFLRKFINFMLFYEKVNFMSFYDFCVMSWNSTSIFCHPSVAIPPILWIFCHFNKMSIEIGILVEMMIFH